MRRSSAGVSVDFLTEFCLQMDAPSCTANVLQNFYGFLVQNCLLSEFRRIPIFRFPGNFHGFRLLCKRSMRYLFHRLNKILNSMHFGSEIE